MVNSGDFSKRLQKVMEHYGFSASALADDIGFNRSAISHLLSGRNKPSLEFVLKVLNRFPEVKLYWLLNGEGTFPAEGEEKRRFSRVSEDETEKQESAPLPPKETKTARKDIEKIVVFYGDGTFEEYRPTS